MSLCKTERGLSGVYCQECLNGTETYYVASTSLGAGGLSSCQDCAALVSTLPPVLAGIIAAVLLLLAIGRPVWLRLHASLRRCAAAMMARDPELAMLLQKMFAKLRRTRSWHIQVKLKICWSCIPIGGSNPGLEGR